MHSPPENSREKSATPIHLIKPVLLWDPNQLKTKENYGSIFHLNINLNIKYELKYKILKKILAN